MRFISEICVLLLVFLVINAILQGAIKQDDTGRVAAHLVSILTGISVGAIGATLSNLLEEVYRK